MALKARSRFEKVAIAWLCLSIAVLLVLTYLHTVPGVSSSALETVEMIGLFSALGLLAILLVWKASAIGIALAVAIGALCYYLSEAFPWLKRYPYVGVLAVYAVIRENKELKKYDAVAAELFFAALGYSYGLVIPASRWVRQAFSLGMAAALRDKSVSDRKDDSSGTQ